MENEDIVHVVLNKPFHTFSYRRLVSKQQGDHFQKFKSLNPVVKPLPLMLTGMRNTHGSLVPLQTIGYTAGPVCSWVNHTHGLLMYSLT